jgi:tRNA (cytosine38-C5)-methyltransferase
MMTRAIPFLLSSQILPFALHVAIIRSSLAFTTTASKSFNGKTNSGRFLSSEEDTLSYVELYSGVGGWTMALEEALHRLSKEDFITTKPSRIAALDHSDLCTKVFEHNFGSDKRAFQIERLTMEEVEAWKASIWFMSPPCQPHTRQHSSQEKDLDDPRSSSFLHLCDLLSQLNNLPSLIVCENVIGFERSNSFRKWQAVLADRGYHVGHFHLSPTQVQMPNDRPRYYCVAVQSDHLKDNPLQQKHLQQAKKIKDSPKISLAIPELGVIEDGSNPVNDSTDMPLISSFLDDEIDDSLRIPDKVLDTKASWCFDIVTPNDCRSRFVPMIESIMLQVKHISNSFLLLLYTSFSCFTHSYGRYIKGTGSILYEDYDLKSELLSPEERDFQEDWTKGYDVSKLRYFSGSELARIFGFSDNFSFPSDCTARQQWKLIGNSLNVRVASRLVELGLRMLK